jgi:hypothetical protein
MPLEGRDGGGLVLGHQAAIPYDVRHQDGGEPTLNVCLVHMAPRPKTDFSITKMVKHVLLGVHPWPTAARVAVVKTRRQYLAMQPTFGMEIENTVACVAKVACIFHRP